MSWRISDRADPAALPIADRHYNRQKIGSPQFVPPGACFVLMDDEAPALWVSSHPKPEFVLHEWGGAWMNTTFRREGGRRASEMIRAAVAHTRWKWPNVPELGMVTFVDADKTAPKDKPGWCYRKAGFKHIGFTKGGLWAFQLLPADMPEAAEPEGAQGALDFA